MIEIEAIDATRWRVTVVDGASTTHEVTVTPEQLAHYGAGADAQTLLRASFEFLLEREPASSIMGRFELPVIERYFPEYAAVIRERLGGGS
jgi:hypothetical protein